MTRFPAAPMVALARLEAGEPGVLEILNAATVTRRAEWTPA